MFIKQHNKKLRPLYASSFLFAIYIALAAYINSTFLIEYVGEGFVGLIFIAGYCLSIVGLWVAPKIARLIGHRGVLYSAMALSLLSLLAIIVTNSAIPIILAFIIYIGANTLIYFELDIFVERLSEDISTGGIRGIFLTVMNVAWLITPFISGLILDASGQSFRAVYITGIIILTIVLIILGLSVKDKISNNHLEYPSIKKTIKRVVSNKNLLGVFIASMTLAFFYAIMVIYTPIYMSAHIGFTWLEIGFMLTVMHIPFVLLEYPVGSLADRKWGEKEMMIAGIIIIAIFSILFSIPTLPSIALWTIIFIGSRVGASLLETTTESYFFKHVNEQDDGLISFQRNAAPIAYILAPAIASIFLMFFDLRYLFILLAIIIVVSLFFVSKIQDTK